MKNLFKKDKDLMTEKEFEVLKLMVEGKTNDEIAKGVFLSKSTVKVYLKNIFIKLSAKNRLEATAKAIKLGLV